MTGPSRSAGRRGVRRVLHLVALAVVLGVCALVVPDSAPAPTRMELVQVDQAHGVDLTGSAKDVLWILAVGSDARPGEDMLHTRGDALHLIGIDTKTGAAATIGIPRDSYVDIDGVGSDKINSALYYGGPKLLAKTVGDLIGIQPQFVFVTSFPMFERMVASIGGVDVKNPIAFSDEYLKPKGFAQGKIHLDGYDALAFSRIRHDLIGGDFDRSANQNRVLEAIQKKVHDRADQPGFLEQGGRRHAAQPRHQRLAGHALQARPRRGQHPPREGDRLRAAGRHRRHRRCERGAALHRPGQAAGRRGPRRRHPGDVSRHVRHR